jgi:hypothetical protein
MPIRRTALRADGLTAVVALFVLGFLSLWLMRAKRENLRPSQKAPESPAAEVLFCHWNVENLFDDRDDPENNDADENWFGRHPEAVRAKVDPLADALVYQNGGDGPKFLELVDVESRRAVEFQNAARGKR